MDLEKLKAIAEAATPGVRLEREDTDYYQGGTYVGVGPEKFIPDPDKAAGHKRVPCAPGEQTYFERDLYRVEGTDADKVFALTFNPETVNAMLDVCAAANVYAHAPITSGRKSFEAIEDALAALAEKIK